MRQQHADAADREEQQRLVVALAAAAVRKLHSRLRM